MSVIQAAGSFDSRITDGSQTINPTGFSGVTPKALILWVTMRLGENIVQDGAYLAFGVATGASNQYGLYSGSQNGQATSHCASRYSSNKILIIKSGDPRSGTLIQCGLTSFTSGAFNLSWTNAPGTAIKVNYLVFGGADLTAQALAFNMPTSNSTPSFTGFGFQPEKLVVGFSHVDSTNVLVTTAGGIGIGATDGTNEHCSFAISQGEVGTTNTNRIQTSRLMNVVDAGGTERHRGAFSAFESDGFSVAFTNTHAVDYRFIALAMKGMKMEVGTFLTHTTTGTDVVSTSIQGQAALLGSVMNVATASPTSNALMMIGGSGGVNSADNVCCGTIDRTGQGTSIGYEFEKSSGACLKTYTQTSLSRHTATVSVYGASSLTMNYSEAVATEYEVFFVAFGDALITQTIVTPSPADSVVDTNGPIVTISEPVTPAPADFVVDTLGPNVLEGAVVTPAPADAVVDVVGPLIFNEPNTVRHRRLYITTERYTKIEI